MIQDQSQRAASWKLVWSCPNICIVQMNKLCCWCFSRHSISTEPNLYLITYSDLSDLSFMILKQNIRGNEPGLHRNRQILVLMCLHVNVWFVFASAGGTCQSSSFSQTSGKQSIFNDQRMWGDWETNWSSTARIKEMYDSLTLTARFKVQNYFQWRRKNPVGQRKLCGRLFI